MQIFLTILHLMLCFGLILIILLQPGKEGASVLGGGGGGNQMYGPRGTGNLLSRGTTLIAAMFMMTSIALAWYSSDRTSSGSDIGSELERLQAEQTETVAPAAAPAPVDVPAPSPEAAPEAPAAGAPAAPASDVVE